MTLILVIALAALAVLLAPVAVRFLDRKAGWPLAALFIAGAVALGRELPRIIDGEVLYFSHSWVPDVVAPGMDVTLSLRGDALGVFFALLALVIGAVVFIYSAAYLPKKQGNTSFYTLMTAFTLSILILVLADDVILLFLAWELVSLASFMLIARSGSGGEAGSVRTLILTFVGGLTLLAAMAIAATQTGTTHLHGILSSDFWANNPGVTAGVAVLVAVSAFTKSAQLPFHFWLPEAMAAATPVSAFLHAAAVVKAGIYLLLRFSTIFHDVAVWNWLLIVVGMTTAVMSAAFAVQKTDLKQLTAYSTVSHLGWIVATIGVGTPFAIAAAVVHTLAHALFKSSLFMLIGVIDHEAGSRDIRRLGKLWDKMPFTFGSVVIGAASMAAVPPLMGFVSKEGMLTAFQDAPASGLLLAAAALGAVLTFTYSAKIVFGAFVDGPRDMSHVHEAPVALWLPAALPGLMSLPLVFVLPLFDAPVDAIVGATGADVHSHLALWHGINTPLLISVGVLIVGTVGIIARKRIWPVFEGRSLFPRSGNEYLRDIVKAATAAGRALGAMANTHNPSRHLLPLVLSVIVLGGATTWASISTGGGLDGVALLPRAEGLDNPWDLIPLAIIALSVLGLMVTRNRISAAVLLGTAGVGMSLQMMFLGAPDVALTQLTVEALTVIVIMMVLRYQPEKFPPVRSGTRQIGSIVIALLAGLTAFLGVYTLMGRRDRSELAMWYLEEAPKITGGQNVVATILVEFRALDTLGELSVLGMAAVVIAAVVQSMPRHPFKGGTRPAPFGQSQLNSIPMRKVIVLVIPILAVLSLLVFMRGHQDPGGGFVAALIMGAAIGLAYLSKGRDSIVFRESTPMWLTGLGIIIALIAGFIGLFKGSFLYAIHGYVFGIHQSTSLIFDLGIYLAVLGMLTMAINALGGYLRPGTETEDLEWARNEDGPLPKTAEINDGEDTAEAFPQPINPAQAPRSVLVDIPNDGKENDR
ncbi:DUF4040 family protein [Corynebacterium testudinoris]|uniref:DUF4040 family protein n=1 Tax=Corynebacterium testudinoris TaxID=136857 RepID=UPI001C8CBACF|nr:DUF4040 family protein [Corynebacterium testudinoris]MBX8995800.1 DUF4040 family protein [Corynebacterium testudinoris]